MKEVDIQDLKSCGESHTGSIPVSGTNLKETKCQLLLKI